MAAGSADVRVEGARALRAALKRAGVSLEDLKDAHAKVAALVAAAATARAPRRTGRLAGDVRGNRANNRARVSAGRAAIPYAGPIHWGWPSRGIDAQPFIREAAQDTETVWLAEYERNIRRIVDAIDTGIR